MDFSRKRKSLDKQICKYGLSCYQKNPEHHKKFKHPPKCSQEENQKFLSDVIDMFSEECIALSNPREKTPKKQKSPSDVIDMISFEECVVPTLSKPRKDSFLRNVVNKDAIKLEETVGEILKSMPTDFFDFWNFCSTVNKSNPQDAFSNIGYKLVGIYDLLAKELPAKMKVDISCHWRYFYDPPEFQTVIQKAGKDLYHIGYFRDDPSEKPSILASNSAAIGEKLNLMGDNIFCAMSVELKKNLKTSQSEATKNKASKLYELLQKFAVKKKYSINVQSSKTKQRQQNVVAKTFHGLGIVVPVKNDIGYRPLPDSNSVLRKICTQIVAADNERERLEREECLDELISNVHFANDECDFGTGYELGIDLFCFGDPYFHITVDSLLTVAYKLLKRDKYASIVKAHLKNRKKGDVLCTLNV